MIVAASTECFSFLSLRDAITKLVDLEFSSVESIMMKIAKENLLKGTSQCGSS